MVLFLVEKCVKGRAEVMGRGAPLLTHQKHISRFSKRTSSLLYSDKAIHDIMRRDTGLDRLARASSSLRIAGVREGPCLESVDNKRRLGVGLYIV